MGAIRKTLLAEHQTWRLFMCPLLHAGVFHFMINLLCIIFIGIYLEKEFGSSNRVILSGHSTMLLDLQLDLGWWFLLSLSVSSVQ